MRIEVLSPEIGLLRVMHARRAAASPLERQNVIDAIVLSPFGVTSHSLSLTVKQSGRGEHLVFACPECCGACAVVFARAGNVLACASCANHRTRRQRESATESWRELNGELEDRLWRSVLKRNFTLRAIERLGPLASELVSADIGRFESLRPLIRDALTVVDEMPTAVG